jgi:maleylacetate reductase
MRSFTYVGLPARVVFGVGSLAQLPAELDRLGARRALLLSTPEQADAVRQVAASLGNRAAGVYDKAAMHVPLAIAEDARRANCRPTSASPWAVDPRRDSARRSR